MESKEQEIKIYEKPSQTRAGFEKMTFRSTKKLREIVELNNGKIVLIRSKGKTLPFEKNRLYMGTISPANDGNFYFTEGLGRFNPKHIIPYLDIEKFYLLDGKDRLVKYPASQ